VLKELDSDEALDECLAGSAESAALLFKHSTACPVSAAAYERVRVFEAEAGEACPDIFLVKVIEQRSLSNAIAERLSVRHQSPQLILVRNGEAVWHASHSGIRADGIVEALEESGG
jgi:bacillithiol system protein YtxJ